MGEFHKGQRIGIWSIWDSTGVLKIQRNYTNNKTFEFIYPVNDYPYKNLYTQFLTYRLERNEEGVYPYLHIEERTVVYSLRTWRQLNVTNEPELFKLIDFESVVKKFFDEVIQWYLYGKNADLQVVLESDTALKREYKNWDFSRIEIKEDFFFNSDNLMSDTRQVGLSFYKNKEDKQPTYLLYFPNLREVFSTFKMKVKGFDEVENLDDFFFFNFYRGKNVKRTGIEGTKVIEDKAIDLNIDYNKLRAEHELWLKYGR